MHSPKMNKMTRLATIANIPREDTPTSSLWNKDAERRAERRVFQESERNDDEGEDELQDLAIDRFVNDLKGEFAHEIRHGDLWKGSGEEIRWFQRRLRRE